MPVLARLLKWDWQGDALGCESRWIRAFRELAEVTPAERFQRTGKYSIKKMRDRDPLYKQDYVVFCHRRDDYSRGIDQLADAFTEWHRLHARMSFCDQSPAQYHAGHPDVTREQLFRTREARECTSFRPTNVVLTLKLLFATADVRVNDPFAGWGDRAIGAAAAGALYRGVDLNANLRRGYDRLIRFLEAHALTAPGQIDIATGDATSYEWAECDLVFTCPPYWNLEVYAAEPQFATAADWCDRVLVPAMRRAAASVRPGGHVVYMLNRKDCSDCSDRALERMLRAEGLCFDGIIGSTVDGRPADREQPLFVWTKPILRS